MNLNQLKPLTLGSVLLLMGGMASLSYMTSNAQSVSQAGAPDNVLKDIAGYRN